MSFYMDLPKKKERRKIRKNGKQEEKPSDDDNLVGKWKDFELGGGVGVLNEIIVFSIVMYIFVLI